MRGALHVKLTPKLLEKIIERKFLCTIEISPASIVIGVNRTRGLRPYPQKKYLWKMPFCKIDFIFPSSMISLLLKEN